MRVTDDDVAEQRQHDSQPHRRRVRRDDEIVVHENEHDPSQPAPHAVDYLSRTERDFGIKASFYLSKRHSDKITQYVKAA